jgi:D-tyrosyl-tRNA(Tyr) deacylase
VIGLLQRVQRAWVEVEGRRTGEISAGLMVLVGVERQDTEAQAGRLLERLLGYRVFADERGRMNRSLADVGGGLLLVPQFTLVADTRKGTRPGFSGGASPEAGERVFLHLLEAARARHQPVETGVFGAHMQVGLVNDGPVTFWLQTR